MTNPFALLKNTTISQFIAIEAHDGSASCWDEMDAAEMVAFFSPEGGQVINSKTGLVRQFIPGKGFTSFYIDLPQGAVA